MMDRALMGLFVSGSLLYPSSFLAWSYILRPRVSEKAVRVQLAASLTAILQHIMASITGSYIVFSCYHDFLYARCWVVDVYMCLGAPYMVYDIGAMYACYHADIQSKHRTKISNSDNLVPFLKQQRLMICHHVMVVFVGFPVAMFFRNGKGDFFIGCMFLTEVSSPFVNIRVILKKMEKTETKSYWINDAMILILFLLFRVLIFPIIFWIYSWNRAISWYQVPIHIPWHCTAGCTMIGTLQLLWYLRFVRGYVRRSILGLGHWKRQNRTRWYLGTSEIAFKNM